MPIASTKLGARKVAAARSSEVQACVTERSQASLPARCGSWCKLRSAFKCWRPRSSSGAQSGRHQSAFQDHSERIINLHTANGNRYWPTASADTSTSTPRRPGRSPRTVAKRRRVTLAVATHSFASRLIRVFSGVYSWFHLQCVFGVLLGVGRWWQVVMILGPDHEPPVLSQSSGHWLMTRVTTTDDKEKSLASAGKGAKGL